MSFAAITKVAGIKTGDDKSKSVLLWLAFHLNDETGLCCPSISLLRKETEVGSDNTIRSALSRLREKGLVSWTREIEDGCVKRTLYTLHLDAPNVEPTSTIKPTSSIEVHQTLRDDASAVDGGYFNGCEGVPQPLKGNREIEQVKEQGSKDFYVETLVASNRSLFPDEVVEPVARSASRYPDCPYQELLALYHEKLPMLPTVMTLTPSRKAQLKARWNQVYREEECASKEQCMEVFGLIFDRISNSRFLTGATNPGPGRERPFRATFDWIVKESNFVKICENRYV